MDTPVVSVIIAAYNAEEFILRAVRSALEQTLERIEVIVVDDASTDNTLSLLGEIGDPRLRILKLEENRGPGYARNCAIALSRGDWVAVMDADDWFHRERLRALVDAGLSWNADVVSDSTIVVDDDSNSVQQVFAVYRKAIDAPLLLSPEDYVRWTVLVKPVFRRAFIEQWDIRFPEDRRVGEDYWFALECLLRGARSVCLPECYYYYTHRSGSLSHSGYTSIKQGIEVRQALLKDDVTGRSPAVRKLLRKDILREKREFALLLAKHLMTRSNRALAFRELVNDPSLIAHLVVRTFEAVRRRVARFW